MWGKFFCQPGLFLGILVFLGIFQPSRGEISTDQDQLLALVAEDFGFCLVVNDLGGHWEKVQHTGWFKAFRKSPLGETLAGDPEMQRLALVDQELKKHFQIDWAQFRDEILGGTLVLAYRPPVPEQSPEEEGLLLLRARNPRLLKDLIDRLNHLQKESRELKELTAIIYRNQTYYRRVDKNTPHYYLLDGGLLAFSAQEKRLREVIDRLENKTAGLPTLKAQLKRAGMEDALATLLVKPRALDADIRARALKAPAPGDLALKTFLQYWQGLDNMVLALKLGENPELRLSIQGRPENLPAPVRSFFSGQSAPSELWQFFPGNALVRVAGRIDAAALVQLLEEFTPPPARKVLAQTIQRNVGAALGLDPARDVLPNLGPDWGLCLAPGANPETFPHLVAALKVKPGTGEVPVDKALFKAAQFFAGLAVFDHNRKNPDPIHQKMAFQEQVEVPYLVSAKVFPSGFQPALALKSGFFLLASSPEAIKQFRKNDSSPAVTEEKPLVHLSFRYLSEWLKNRQDKAAGFLAQHNNLTPAAARQNLDNILAGLELFDHALLSQRNDPGQVTWALRLRSPSRSP